MKNAYIPHSVTLPVDIKLERVPDNLNDISQYEIDTQFDKRTIYYDIFYSSLKDKIYFIGPPLLNLRKCLFIKYIYLDNMLVEYNIVDLNCIHFVELNIPSDFNNNIDHSIDVHFNIFKHSMTLCINPDPISSYLCLATLQKNNPVKWINEWCNWHHVVHHVNTIILYDNGCNKISEFIDRLEIPEACNILIVKWNYIYGIKKTLQTYAQIGALNHLRLKWGHCYKWIISLDVDEYLYLNNCVSLTNYLHIKEHKFVTAINICQIIMPAVKLNSHVAQRSAYQYVFRYRINTLTKKVRRTYKYIYQPSHVLFNGVHSIGMYQRNMSPYPFTLKYDNILRILLKIFNKYLIHVIPFSMYMLRKMRIPHDGSIYYENVTKMCYYHYLGLNTEWKRPTKYDVYNTSIHEPDLNVINIAKIYELDVMELNSRSTPPTNR